MIMIDTETGGLDPHECALISIGAMHVPSKRRFYGVICPPEGLRLDPDAESVHGLTLDYLMEQGLPEAEVIEKFGRWVREFNSLDWCGCNPAFDLAFLRAAAARSDVKLPLGGGVDLQSLAWLADRIGLIELPSRLDGKKSRSLDAIVKALDMPGRESMTHSSIEDVILSERVLVRLLGRFEQ